MQKQVERDTRKTVKGNDIKERYADYRNWSTSKLAKDIERVYNLLPENEEITVKDLKVGLSKYDFDPSYQEKVIKELGSNDVRVKATRNSYSHSINNDDVKISRRTE